MKKLISILAMTVLTTSASAKADFSGMMTLIDGSTTVKISVGEKNTNQRDMARRIRRLERAVRDLQNRVYDLEVAPSEPQTRTVWACSLQTEFFGVFTAKAPTEILAKAKATEKCLGKAMSMWCDDEEDMKCDSYEERI